MSATTEIHSGDRQTVTCKRCGTFQISGSAIAGAESISEEKRWYASAWIAHNRSVLVTSVQIDAFKTEPVRPSLMRRAEDGLRYLLEKFRQGQWFASGQLLQSDGIEFLAATWSKDTAEAQFLLRDVLYGELGYLSQASNNSAYIVSPRGWLALERKQGADSTIGFVAMWFDEAVAPLFTNVIQPGIRDAGYDELKIDQKEHNNKIDDEIIASIRSARFVVADYTGERGGVYYEAGFAHGLGLPVIFMAQKETKIHFDVRQYNTIFWTPDNFEDAKKQLTNRILATIGRGPLQAE